MQHETATNGRQAHSRRQRRRRSMAFASVVAATLSVTGALGPLTEAAPPGDLSDSLVSAGTLGATAELDVPLGIDVNTGPIAPLHIGCVNDVDARHQEVVGVTVPIPGTSNIVLESGTMVGDIAVTREQDVVDVVATETIESASLLDGLIEATGVEAVAHSQLTEAGVMNLPPTGATFLSLTIGDDPVADLTPEPNTEIEIPLVGLLVLNEQIPTASGIRVNAMHLYIENFVGTSGEVVLASANTHLTAVEGQLGGEAYAARVKGEAPTIEFDSAKLVRKALKCPGTNGNPRSLVALSIDQAPVLTSGTATSTVSGDIVGGSAFADASHTIESLSLLDGLITGELIMATAHTDVTGGVTTNSGNVEFVNVVIAGEPIEAEVSPNTTIPLPGIGFVRLNHQVSTVGPEVSSMDVKAIFVKVTVENDFDLSIGTTIIVAAASTRVRF